MAPVPVEFHEIMATPSLKPSSALETASTRPSAPVAVPRGDSTSATSTGTTGLGGGRRSADGAATQELRAVRAGRSQLGEEIRVLYRYGKNSIWANFAAVVAYVVLAYEHVPVAAVVLWTVLASGLLVGRYLLIEYRLSRPGFPSPASRLGIEYAVGTTLTGLVFAAGFATFVPHMPDYERSLILVAIAGMCAGAAVSMGSYRPAYYGYAASLLATPVIYGAVNFARDGSLVVAAEIYVVAAYFCVVVVIHTGARHFIRESIALQLDNHELVTGLRKTNRRLSQDRDALKVAAFTDSLTGVPNRRSFDETLRARWRDGIREETPLGCLLVDIDYFKPFNDRYGHDAGDRCLKRVAAALSDVVHRDIDCAARYGGEEFAVVLPNTSSAGALYIAELIRQEVNDLAIPHEGAPLGVVTVSVGATSVTPTTEALPVELVRRADQALYAAKEHGRNRVQLLRGSGEITADSGPQTPAA